MNIQVLGTGCTKCNKLYAEAEKAVAQVGGGIELSKVEKIEEIAKFGALMTPALAIDGAVVSMGKIPDAGQIATWLREARREK